MVQPELAATLKRLQDHGWREFYTGLTAQLIARDMAAHGGWITAKDLADYKAEIHDPLKFSYRGYPILAVAPSAGGGLQLSLSLNILERQSLPVGDEGSSWTRQLQIEALRRSQEAVRATIGKHVANPVALLTSKDFAAQAGADLAPGIKAAIRHAATPSDEAPDTTHFSVVDAQGNIVTNTYTLSGFYGSQVIAKGTGVLLNDLNRHYSARSFLASGRRYVSSMSGVIVLHPDGTPWAAFGSPGGDTIPSTVMQVVNNLIDFKMSLEDAIAYPRIHYDVSTASVEAEPGALVSDVADRLKALGYTLNPRLRSQGDAEAVAIDDATGFRVGAPDLRRGGAAAGY